MESFERTFSLQVPSSTENLSIIRDFISKVGARAGFDENQIAFLALAVDEACANVIEHAYKEDPTHQVTVRALLDDMKIALEIIHGGEAFDASEVKPKSVEDLIKERRSGGLGLRIIRSVMDEIEYKIVPGELNVLRMLKWLKKPQPQG
jgi:serine/threonine-protein kinase RsbW